MIKYGLLAASIVLIYVAVVVFRILLGIAVFVFAIMLTNDAIWHNFVEFVTKIFS